MLTYVTKSVLTTWLSKGGVIADQYLCRSNAQRSGMVMWDEVINEVAKDFPDVKLDHMLGTLTLPSFRAGILQQR